MPSVCRILCCGLLLVSFSCSGLAAQTKPIVQAPAGFDLKEAMNALFGNFDPKTGSSHSSISQATASRLQDSWFKNGDEIIVRPLRILEAQEDGKHKSILVTFSVPKVNFDCHACRPFIGVVVFVRNGDRWEVESRGDMITYSGGFGEPSRDFRVVHVGPGRIGIQMTDSDEGQGGQHS